MTKGELEYALCKHKEKLMVYQGFIQDFWLGGGTRWAIKAPPPRPDPSEVMYAYMYLLIK